MMATTQARGYGQIAKKKSFLHSVSEVVVPTGVTKMPNGLGTAKNGKLKTSKWHSLFAIHAPLVCIDLFIYSDNFDACFEKNKNSINNLWALVTCTIIIGSKKILIKHKHQFQGAYNTYLKTLINLYPSLQVLPNHHYALHIPDQLSHWGPLMQLSEFPGERLIGILQNYKTNYGSKYYLLLF